MSRLCSGYETAIAQLHALAIFGRRNRRRKQKKMWYWSSTLHASSFKRFLSRFTWRMRSSVGTNTQFCANLVGIHMYLYYNYFMYLY